MAEKSAIFFHFVDAARYESKALPAGGANADCTAQTIPAGDRSGMKIGIKVPDLTTTQLPDGETLTFIFYTGDGSTHTTEVGRYVVTGASGAGASDIRYYCTPFDSADVSYIVNVAASASAAASAVSYEVGVAYA